MRVLVTGAAGQVGAAIATDLGGRGFDVVGAGRTVAKLRMAEAICVQLGTADAPAYISEHVSRCDAIIHAAASLSRLPFDPSIPLTNCLGTQQVLELAESWGVQNVVYISSVPVIGFPPAEAITEEHPVNPLTAYHASKVFGEHLVRLACNANRSTVSLRITSPVGPRTPEHQVMAVFAKRARENQPLTVFGAGTRRQNYVDVRDVAIAVWECLDRNARGLYNIAAEDSISDLDLARRCVAALESRSTIDVSGSGNPDNGVIWNVSISKAHQDLGYSPRYTIDESIRSLNESG